MKVIQGRRAVQPWSPLPERNVEQLPSPAVSEPASHLQKERQMNVPSPGVLAYLSWLANSLVAWFAIHD